MLASVTIDHTNATQRLEMPWADPRERSLSLDERIQLRLQECETLEQTARILYWLLNGGFSVWSDGRLLSTRVLVAALGPLQLVIHPREHSPPHFHVIAPDIDASFAILDCAHLRGSISDKNRRLVEYWHAAARPRLVDIWNATRPSDCPVGPLDL